MSRRYGAYVEGLEHNVVQLAGNWPTKRQARKIATEFIRSNPQRWNEYDSLVIVRELERVPVDPVVMGA